MKLIGSEEMVEIGAKAMAEADAAACYTKFDWRGDKGDEIEDCYRTSFRIGLEAIGYIFPLSESGLIMVLEDNLDMAEYSYIGTDGKTYHVFSPLFLNAIDLVGGFLKPVAIGHNGFDTQLYSFDKFPKMRERIIK